MENEAIKLNELNGIIVFSIMTDFTIAMEKLIQDLYAEVCDKGYKRILIKFNSENHVTSGGIAILINLLSESQKKEQKIGITGLSDHFKKTFKMIGITRYTTIYDSVEEALQKMQKTSI